MPKPTSQGVSQDAGEGQACPLGSLFSFAAESAGADHMAAPLQPVRLFKARGHLRARQIFMQQIHRDAPDPVTPGRRRGISRQSSILREELGAVSRRRQ